MRLKNKIGTSSLLALAVVLGTSAFAMDPPRLEDTGSTVKAQKVDTTRTPSLEGRLAEEIGNVFGALSLDRKFGQVAYSNRPEADFTCAGILKLPKNNTLDATKAEIIQKIEAIAMISKAWLTPQNHINILVNQDVLASYANNMLHDKRLGVALKEPLNMMIDFGGPNIAKPMHVGHLRSSVVGDSLQRLCRFMGDKVTSDIHLGDWGFHIGTVINGIKKRWPDLSYFKTDFDPSVPCPPVVTTKDLDTIYPEESSICKTDAVEKAKAREITTLLQQGHPGYLALWKHISDVSIEDLKKNFSNLGINFDLWWGESSVNNIIPQIVQDAKEKNVAVVTDGATTIAVAESTDKEPVPPLLLVKSNGGYTYHTTDLATVKERMEKFHPDYILYVVDQRQSLHFKQVFRAAHKLQMGENVVFNHAGFGTVNGKDKKPFKTREGGVMRLDDLISMAKEKALKIIEERRSDSGVDTSETKKRRQFTVEESHKIAELVGISAIKYADLSHNRLKDYVFDLDKMISFQGETGPFILYSAVRIKTILEKAIPFKSATDGTEVTGSFNAEERGLILTLSRLQKTLDLAYLEKAPHPIALHAMEIAKSFNGFYQTSPVLDKQKQTLSSSRLALSILTLKNLELTLSLLGIEIPDHM